MRNTIVTGAVASGLILFCLTAAAWAADCGCGGMSNRSYQSLSGPPCFSPPGCFLAPGCCECPPSACDNAWAGYCQQKAKWQAYFTQVGTRNPCGCAPRGYCAPRGGCVGGGCGAPTPAMKQVPAENSPTQVPHAVNPHPDAAPLPPMPEPEKTSRAKVLYPWMR